jgi:hypothetical protein
MDSFATTVGMMLLSLARPLNEPEYAAWRKVERARPGSPSAGATLLIVSDNGTELTSNSILAWQIGRG